MAEMTIEVNGEKRRVSRTLGEAFNRAILAQTSAVDTAGVRQNTTARQRGGARGALATWSATTQALIDQMDANREAYRRRRRAS